LGTENGKVKGDDMKTAIRRIGLALALGMAFGPLPSQAATATVDGVTWKYTVSGNAATLRQLQLGCYSGDLAIPSKLGGCPVKTIGEAVFACCGNLTSVSIPDTVTSIGNNAFYNSGLLSVEIPRSVTSIGDGAFEFCRGLASVSIAGNVKSIGTAAFYACDALTDFTITGKVKSIGMSAFRECNGLTSLAFADRVERIGKWAFRFCGGLETVALPDNVTSLGDEAFEGCPVLRRVEIGAGVASMGTGVFSDCGVLQEIEVAPGNPKYASEGGVLFTKDKRTLVQYPSGREGAYAVPAGVRNIGNGAFEECRFLTGVELGAGVTNIGENAFAFSGITAVALPQGLKSIGSGAFSSTGLEAVEIPDGVARIGGWAFSSCSLAEVVVPDGVTSFGPEMFYGCGSLVSATLGKGVKKIGDHMFSGCTNLASVTYGAGVTNIGEFAFNGCRSLATAPIGAGVKAIGQGAFRSCDGLETVQIPASVRKIGGGNYGTFENCRRLSAINVDAGNPKYASRDGVLYSKNMGTLIQYPAGKLGHFLAPDSLTNVAASAFSDCIGLTSAAFPNVVSIGAFAFYNCGGLTYVWFPDNLKKVGAQAFYGCQWLSKLYLSGFWEGTSKTSVFNGASLPEGCEFSFREVVQEVKFNANGGICGTLAAYYNAGETYDNLPPAEWAGHVFTGWWTAKTGGTRVVDGETVVPKATKRTLYAHWTTGQTLTYDANGGTCKAKNKKATIGKAYGTLATATWAGHAFLGWWTARDGGEQVTAKTKAGEATAATVYAHWTDRQTVAFAANGGNCGEPEKIYAIGEAYGGLPIASKPGSAFNGWWTAKSGGKRVTEASVATETAARTLWAHWTKTQTLAYDANGGKCKTKSKKATVGKKYGALATATLAGHGFTGWWTEREGGIPVTAADLATEEASRTVYAQWTMVQTVAFDANGGTCAPTSAEYGIGDVYGSLPEAVKAGSAFAGWWTAKSGGKKVTKASVVTEKASRTLYARWTKAARSPGAISAIAVSSRGGAQARSAGTEGGTCTLIVETEAGVEYEVQWTETLGGEWTTVKRWVAEEDGECEVEVPVAAGAATGFYRVSMME
jgi:hypothetical protein